MAEKERLSFEINRLTDFLCFPAGKMGRRQWSGTFLLVCYWIGPSADGRAVDPSYQGEDRDAVLSLPPRTEGQESSQDRVPIPTTWRSPTEEIRFEPSAGKLEFFQAGTAFTSRQHGELVLELSLGEGLRTLLELQYHIQEQASGPRETSDPTNCQDEIGTKGLKSGYHQAGVDTQEDRQSYSTAALGGKLLLRKSGCSRVVSTGDYPMDTENLPPDLAFGVDIFTTHIHERLRQCTQRMVEHLNYFRQAERTESEEDGLGQLTRFARQIFGFLGLGGLAAGMVALREVADLSQRTVVVEQVIQLQEERNQVRDRIAGQLIEDLKLIADHTRAQDRGLTLLKSALEALGYSQGACSDAERLEAILDNLRDRRMPLRLLSHRQLAGAYSDFTNTLAQLELMPLASAPRFLLQDHVRSRLVRRPLPPDQVRTAGTNVTLFRGKAAEKDACFRPTPIQLLPLTCDAFLQIPVP